LSLGAGFENTRLYKPGGAALRIGSYFLAGRVRKPSKSGKNVPYALVTWGQNILTKTGDHWQGKSRLSAGLGTRLGLVPGYSIDLGVHQHWLFPKPHHLQYAEVRWGVVFEFGKSSPEESTKEPTPSSTPTSSPVHSQTPPPTVTATPTEAAPPDAGEFLGTPTATRTPTATEVPFQVRNMKAVYERGIAAYKLKDYPNAVKYLREALTIQDETTKYWYYAEAHAMLGVMYQKFGKQADRFEKARYHYQEALKVDPRTATAIRGLKSLGAKGKKPVRRPVRKVVPRSSPAPTAVPTTAPSANPTP
jgi:tetratricopeptide (TPR) repeat protein